MAKFICMQNKVHLFLEVKIILEWRWLFWKIKKQDKQTDVYMQLTIYKCKGPCLADDNAEMKSKYLEWKNPAALKFTSV